MTSLDPANPLHRAWGAGYKAGFYPDDFEPIPDVLDGLPEWINGYFAGCDQAHKEAKRLRQWSTQRLHEKRKRENPLIQRILNARLGHNAQADVDNAPEHGTVPPEA